ncbi:IS630 family transposase [Mucilaginibacter sp. BJC16-A38]|uniref:IS630 family transposase n=1 Tax=Mucilaginibacter phenanthrenivorans TaxID=1234842 RepID=UPI002157BA7D|nr:IS630 family transposase [Mucilaginibacter phenanthrenivorans]MCR8559275.1 IS630 family transposase [Mucilaginibacter phenanthrenivorans]
MHRYQLSIDKANILRQRFIDGEYHSYLLAKELRVSTITTWRYKREFERIRAEYPDRLNDFGFYPGEPPRPHWDTPKYRQLALILPALLADEHTPTLETSAIFKKYLLLSSDRYTWRSFKGIFVQWVRDHVTPTPRKLLDHISPEDAAVLKKWRSSNDHRHWQIAKSLEMALQGASRKEIIDKVETIYKTLNQWMAGYKAKGMKAFETAPHVKRKDYIPIIKERKERLFKLIHETPKLYGLNRTSWSVRALTLVYNKLYAPAVSYMQISRCVTQMGYRYKKTRQMLTSPDPKFREKIKKIQSILQTLKPNEKFFSIDEYGGVSIKIKGGRTLKHENESPDVVPEKQKAKGFLICTAALELSTNQVTHFFSAKKNTFEMIKLIDVLLDQYADQETLYLCWDAVSWHNSRILKNYIEDHNKIKKPEIKLAPLPACTQFLNVIESVFAGLARAVIHNSDYASVDECKHAISRHFEARNQHFKTNPKRAGRKIWGKEIVRAKFSENQNCRNRAAMSGAKL